MTKSEFIQNHRIGMQKSRRLLFCGLASFGVCLLGAAVFGDRPAGEAIAAFGFVLFCIIMVLSTAILGRPPRCRRCGKRLEGFSSQIAVATGHCGFCGELAFDDTGDEKVKGAL